MDYLCVFIGGGAGSLLRFISIQFVNQFFDSKYSTGTLFVNCFGAFVVGFLVNKLVPFDVKWRLFFITGFLGGYTTFSTYALETVRYFTDGNLKQGIINILLNNVLSLLFVLLGMGLSSDFIKSPR
ncbi:fluoride efflux transporter CrcB [Leadbettera azotonutricia]|uniref:Fluoride-specific ion channel FluC n=1 Tax=Leadbettera azotonutricia (strain ATCC BAA-888 / DSM 13862 / ZAS-9) TaxID=545695 RepID=F5YDX2_LEAAZ|nr:fluoride efflux transporter CrcB [Leadbettera azotonutricia]AEF81028.1 CrcB protein [Leadbettera azotonutricia ZAS-9]